MPDETKKRATTSMQDAMMIVGLTSILAFLIFWNGFPG